MKIVLLVVALTFIGCSSKVLEPWECECEKTKFKCNGQTMQIDIKDEL